jgi:hypothetical protein
MWKPRRLTVLGASKAYYRDSFIFTFFTSLILIEPLSILEYTRDIEYGVYILPSHEAAEIKQILFQCFSISLPTMQDTIFVWRTEKKYVTN